jgi:large subunit ribosomal protein L22e
VPRCRSHPCPFAHSCALLAPQEKFLREKIKVGGKAGALGSEVKVDRDGAKVTVTTAAHPKRYLKYLAKKYLKKNQLREYLRVVAVNKKENKGGYELRYFRINEEE